MEILKKLEIKNYRGLKKLEFSPRSINIIVGPNNTGKSSILESVSLFGSFPSSFKDSLRNNIIEELIHGKEYRPSYLINLANQKAVIKGNIHRETYTLEIEYRSKGFLEDERSELIFDFLNEYIEKAVERYTRRFYGIEHRKIDKLLDALFKHLPEKTKISQQITLRRYFKEYLRNVDDFKEEVAELFRQDLNAKIEKMKKSFMDMIYNTEKIFITIYNKNNTGLYIYFPEFEEDLFFEEEDRFYRFPFVEEGLYTIQSFKSIEKFPIIFNFQKSAYASNVRSLHDLLVSTGKISNTIDLIKNRVPYVEDIRKTEEDIYVFTNQTNKPIPLSLMGDGFIALVKISFLISLAENGILILEEPEVSVHPGFIEIISEEIVKNAKRVQFFISTHSLDLLNSILDESEKEDKLDEVNIIRIHRREDIRDIYPEILSGKEAKEEIEEIGTDLRYV